MFTRPQETYDLKPGALDKIIEDKANPLNCIARLIPNGASVLDIGAGNGLLGLVLNRIGKSVHLDGIEPDSYGASLASSVYRSIFNGYFHEHSDSLVGNGYDYVVLADVIEHTEDPLKFLREIVDFFSAETRIIVSLPNIAFGGQRLSLLGGAFNLVDSGILERTHLRFFTLDSAMKLFSAASLSCENVYYLNRSFYRAEFRRSDISVANSQLLKLAFKEDARAYQYLFVLTKGNVKNTLTFSRGATFNTILFDLIFYRKIFIKFFKAIQGLVKSR